MRLKLFSVLLALGVQAFAATPYVPINCNFEDEDPQFEIPGKVLNTPVVRAFTFQGTNVWNPVGYNAYLSFGEDANVTNMVVTTGTCYSTYIDFQIGSNTFAYPVTHWYCSVMVTKPAIAGTYSIAYGYLNIKAAPEVNANGSFFYTRAINGSEYGPFTGSFSNWPFALKEDYVGGYVSILTWNATNLIFENRIKTSETDIANIKLTNSAIQSNLTAEISRATNSESVISNMVVAETSRATNAEVAISNAMIVAVAAETSRATNAEYIISNSIATAVAVETSRATNAEVAVSNAAIAAVAVETARATAAEAAIGTGTWALAVLTDGSKSANYLNIVNTNYLGANIVTNGTFTGSASNWSLSSFYYSGNRVILNPSLTGSIEYTNALVVTTNKMYQLTVGTTYAGAAVTASVGGVTSAWTSVNGSTRTEYFFAINNAKILISAGTGTNSLELDGVTLKECPTGSVFVAQDVNAGNTVRARVAVLAPNITAISNDLDTAESAITSLNSSTNNLNSRLSIAETNGLDLTGGIMSGPATNALGWYGYHSGDGGGLTNVSASSTGLAWTAISGTPTTYGADGYGITNLPATTVDHTALTNQNGSTNFMHLTVAEKAIATNEVGYMYRYAARTNASETVDVLATATGIVVTRTNSTFNFAVPSGVKIVSAKIRVRGDYTDSGKIYLAMGAGDFNSATVATTWIPGVNCFRESDYANVVLTIRPYATDITLAVIAGMGTSAAETYQLRLSF